MSVKRQHITPTAVVVHHTATARDTTTPESVDRYHRKVFGYISTLGSYVGYQYMIDSKGKITQHRSNNEPGAHTKQENMNFNSIGICLTGHFDKEDPSPEQVAQLTELLWQIHVNYGIEPDRVYPHRRFATYKSCYGSRLSDEWAADLLRERIRQQNAPKKEPTIADKVVDLSNEGQASKKAEIIALLDRLRDKIAAL